MDAILTPYMTMFASTWALAVAGLLLALPMIYTRVHDTTEEEEEQTTSGPAEKL